MKSSSVPVMIQAYQRLSERVPYPLHLGVTEAGPAFTGTVKSSIGIGALLAQGIGDTIRVSLTEDPEAEVPVAFALAGRYEDPGHPDAEWQEPAFDPFHYARRATEPVHVGNGRGAVVAMNPHTGAVDVMASTPGYDANGLDRRGRFAALNRDPGSPVFNRSTQSSYPPGSTFKVVTAIAAIDSGRYTPDSTVSGRNGRRVATEPGNDRFRNSPPIL